LGKTVPFFLIGFLEASFISVVGILWFDVPFRGSIVVLALGTALFLLCALGIGLFLSTISVTQQQAMVSGFFFIMPAMVLSGFATPIAAMPEILQWLTYLDPLRYFLVVLRGAYLKGVGLEVLWPQMAAMAIFGFVMLTISVFRFQKSLD
jgi:ABC-2 type transport system permease protein